MQRTDPVVRGAKARPIPSQLVGVFRVLSEQHREAAALIEQIQSAPARRAVLWPTLRQALVSHEHSEVRELYPVLRQRAETSQLADHHDEEARDLDAMIDRLDRTPSASDAWGPLFDQLAQTVLAHAEEEESSIFPAAQSAFGEATAKALTVTVLAAKDKLMLLH